MKFSFSLLFSGLFIAYMLHSMYGLVQIFIPPKCYDQHCLKSFLESKPKLQLILCTTPKASIQSWNELTVVDKWNPLDYDSEFISKNVTIPIPISTRRNGSLYMYAFATPVPRSERESWIQSIQSPQSIYAFFQLSQYLVPEAETYNLLKNGEFKLKEEKSKKESKIKGKNIPIAHIAKRVKLTMLTDLLVLPAKDLPPDFGSLLRMISSDTYLPPLRFDKFSSRLKDFYKINMTDDNYQLQLEFAPMSIGNIRMGAQFEAAMEMMQGVGFTVKDMDEIKALFSETNMYLLTLTMLVASLHLLFDFLAFKNDVTYWRNRKTTVGLSSKTILWRCFSQIVVFFYLMEEKSSMLVILPSGIGALIEIWKVTKAFKISLKFEGRMPRLNFGQLSESERATAQHDVDSMKYLSYILYPLCFFGAVYSLMYTPHRSWYSWTVQSLVNGVYAFGFLFMLPQLFVNYRLKSVAHLPWRAFMYKAFNTFIDDLFAFIITMPTAHRMACFRDDIVFLIYLYQRWLYPVDNTRLDAGGEFEFEVEGSTPKVESKPLAIGGGGTGNKHKSLAEKKAD